MSQVGRIFDIQRFSIHDGPGIRTTVFLKGCPLHCLWCHNPEGIPTTDQLSFLPDKCIGCGYCFRACPNVAHTSDGEEHILNRELCQVCGKCAEECCAKALEIVGRDISVTEVLAEVLRDRPFYETSGGGMTLSGGEPMLQIDFSEALLKAAKEEGLHCALETCGQTEWSRYERVLSHVDLFLFDIKETDPVRHKEYTGADNALILANIKKLHDSGAAMIMRLPTIPGLNDRPEHFQTVAKLVKTLPNLQGVEVMPYHRLGLSKEQRFGLAEKGDDRLREIESPDSETVLDWVTQLRDAGVNVLNEI
jgi:glycyl-radical enzyme activating protein